MRRGLTVLRKPDDGRWSEVEKAKVMAHFGVPIGTDIDHPEDLALVGDIKGELIEEFRLAHPDFSAFTVLRINGNVI